MADTKKLNGKVAIVTASTDGIGYAIAERLGLDGAKVVVSSRKQKKVDDAVKAMRAKNIDVIGCVCHVSKTEDRAKLIKQTVDHFGGIDIVVSNAAVNPFFGNILDTPETAFDKIIDVNLKATFLLCKETVPYLQKRGGGSIILVSSTAGYVPDNFLGIYSVSKTAMLGLTNALVPQLSTMNIRINCLAPGLIQTRFSEALWKDENNLQMAKSRIPLGRIGQPDDCAGIVSFLASDDASYMTGQTVVVNGGLHSRL